MDNSISESLGVDMQALKMSAIAGLATGVGSLGLYMMLAGDASQTQDGDEVDTGADKQKLLDQKAQQEREQYEEQDAKDLESVK